MHVRRVRLKGILRYALESLDANWRSFPDNFLVKVRSETWMLGVARLRHVEWWESALWPRSRRLAVALGSAASLGPFALVRAHGFRRDGEECRR